MNFFRQLLSQALLLGVVFVANSIEAKQSDDSWKMHVIDDSSRGADGVRLGDFDQDGMQDIVTGWEEGGVVRVYRNPGPLSVRKQWPSVTVGNVRSAEDAVFCDLDGNGILDVVSCCEGQTRRIYFHWAPDRIDDYLVDKLWTTEEVPCTVGRSAWMFALPMQLDQKYGCDLVVGSKNPNGQVAFLLAPAQPKRVSEWTLKRVETAGWIMSLRKFDFDQDGKMDILVSDRRGKSRGVYSLAAPKLPNERWHRVDVVAGKREWMFLDSWTGRLAGNDSRLVAMATRNGKITIATRGSRRETKWATREVSNPASIQNGKAVAVGDINLDGRVDLVHAANTSAIPSKSRPPGIHWAAGPLFSNFESVASRRGRKFDRIELLDLDGDGDLDVLTCEEAENLGVIWYENPVRQP